MEQSWIKETCQNVWKNVFEKVKHAVVFLDYQCAECLFWIGGPTILFEAGAIEIKDFSSFESASSSHKKAVFVVSTLLQGKTLTILHDIVASSNFDYCVIITTIDHETHKLSFGQESQFHVPVFEQCEEKICGWMGNMNYTCEIFFYPIFLACYCPFLFIIPSLNNFFPLINQDLLALDSMRKAKGDKHALHKLSDVHFFALPVSYQIQIKMLVSYLSSLFENIYCKEELFAIGATSRLIATQLANLPSCRQRRKSANKTASMIFIDRSLDPVAITKHSETSLADKILGILPELPGHCNNVTVDMVRITTAKELLKQNLGKDEISSVRDVVTCPGCLCPPDEAYPQLLQDVICFPQKKSLDLIKRSLMEAAIEEGITLPEKMKTKSNSEEIFNLVDCFYGNAGAIMYHSNLLQLSMAAAETLSNPDHKKWMNLSAMEKLLILDDDPISKIVEISNELDENEKKLWTVEELLSLVVFACSIRDLSTLSDEVWDELSSSLTLSISDSSASELPEGLCDILNNHGNENNDVNLDVIQDVVEELLNKLKDLSKSRNHLCHFKDLLQSVLGPPVYRPFLVQVIEKILDNSRPDLQSDLEYISTGLMEFLKSGFSMFKKVSQPRPDDARLIIIFVVGGITFDEASSIKKIVDEYNSSKENNLQVVMGSTRLTSPHDAVDKFLFSNNLSPSLVE